MTRRYVHTYGRPELYEERPELKEGLEMSERRRVVVTGTRYGVESGRLNKMQLLLRGKDIIAVGGLTGVDGQIADYCQQVGIDLVYFPALWEQYGRPAGPRRNRLMLDVFKPDLVIALPDKDSKGTWDCVNAAKERGIPVTIIEEEE